MIRKFKKYLELVRFSHTIFALPFAVASMIVASNGLPTFQQIAMILLCMVTARNAAMGFNRLVDVDIDAKNPRTDKRHIVTGEIKKPYAIIFILINALLFSGGAYFLNDLAFYFSFPVLLLLLSYSFWKRFSWLCHLFLGFAIGMSPVGAWIGIRGEFHFFPIALAFVLMLWISGFDIIYATQDVETDTRLGLHSAVVYFGLKGSLLFAKLLHLSMYAILWFMWYFFNLDLFWLGAILLTGVILIYLHFFAQSRSLDELNSDFFRANSIISLLLLIALAGYVYISKGIIA